CARGGNFFAYW
nr:immunoglobulin heavy chain junction region [Mus musculus]